VKTSDERRTELLWLTDNSIAVAKPNDLKTLWKLQKDLEARYGRQGVIRGIGLDQQGVSSSGANFGGVFYRLSWLRHLQILSEASLDSRWWTWGCCLQGSRSRTDDREATWGDV
jgi:hypothetical protein